MPSKVRKRAKLSPINVDFAIEWWPVERAVDYPDNARWWGDAAVEKVANSLKAYGFRQPIVVDRDGVIVIGHLRRTAARRLGLKTVPVHIAKDLTAEQIRGLRLADNRTHDEAEWDADVLKRELGSLKELKIDLAPLGFDESDWARIFKTPDPPAELAIAAELFERQDYIVISIENKFDWQVLGEKLGIETTVCTPNGSSTVTHRRVCRVIPAAKAFGGAEVRNFTATDIWEGMDIQFPLRLRAEQIPKGERKFRFDCIDGSSVEFVGEMTAAVEMEGECLVAMTVGRVISRSFKGYASL